MQEHNVKVMPIVIGNFSVPSLVATNSTSSGVILVPVKYEGSDELIRKIENITAIK
jgi:hypothetical protein